ncbi:YSIRK-type signal peptide-containing protein [Lactobacillus sp. LL6]|uniref:mucin-binding protein n=1 Tax=Lactobacillus sp. LL6 TaxID=2596827 RepID=UPI001186695A|nr:YSIRK-type signal peptide-containing protein [Lactobacillus sp. LL6]TSO26645.1 YSIRK-type signal peptide-containing protein [Lactobacillus sp. LL6]
MLSKNNYNERLHKMEEKNERFSIRKFSAGAASVLIGISFMGMANSQTVKADTNPTKEPTTDSDTSHVAKADTTNVKNINKVVVDANANSSKQENIEETNQSSAQSTTKKVEEKAENSNQEVSQTQNENQESDKTTKEVIAKQATDENKNQTSTDIDVSSLEKAGMAGRSNLNESKVTSDANALKQDAQKQAEKTASNAQDDLVKTATETITVTAPDGRSFQNQDGTTSQTFTTDTQASATRSKNIDSVTGEATYSDWTYNPTDKKFTEQKVPAFNGYTPSADSDGQTIDLTKKGNDYYIPSTDAFTENGEPIDKRINIKYTADQAAANIKYIDNNDKSKTIYTQNVTGVTGQVVSFTTTGSNGTTKLEVPEGWHLIDGQSYASTMTLGPDNKYASQTLYIEKDNTDTPASTYTFTINYINNNQNVAKQEVTGKAGETVNFSLDGANNTTKLNVPEGYQINGKYPSYITFGEGMQTTFDVNVVKTSGSESTDPNATYTYTINYVTKNDNQNVGKQEVTGKTGEKVEFSLDGANDTTKLNVPEGYQINGKYPTQVTFGPNMQETSFDVNVVKKSDSGNTDPNATHTYTINYVTKNDNQNVGSQKVTGKTGEKVDYTLQVPAGYDLVANDEGKIPTGGSVTFGSKDDSTTIYVEKHDASGDVGQPASQVINFVDTDDNNKVIESRTLDGKIGDTQPLIQDGKIAIELPKGYVAVSQQLPANITFAKDAAPIEIKLAHEKAQESWTDHKDDSNYNKVITETITYTYPSENAKTLTNQISYVRNGVKDEVTGKVTYSDWVAATDKNTGKKITSFAEVPFSAIKGYTAVYTDADGQSHTLTPNADNKVVIPAINAPVDGPSTYNLSLVYNNDKTGKPDDPNATYTFTINYLADNQNVGKQEVTGKTGETINFSLDDATNTTKLNVPEGYQINGKYPSEITFGPNMQTSFDVNVQKKTDSGNTGSNTPSDKTSKYTINFVDGNNTVASATLTGTVGASVDIASKVKVPVGYKLADGETLDTNYTFTDQDVTKNIQVVSTNPDSNKVNVTVNYTYNNETIGTTTINVTKGKSQNIAGFVKANVPNGYQVTATIPARAYNENTTLNIPVEKYDPSQDTDKDSVVTQVINYVADGTTVKTQHLTDKVGTSYKVILDGTAQDGEVLIQAPDGYKINQSSISSPIVLQKQSQPITIQVTPIVYSGANPEDAAKYPDLTKKVTGIYKYNILGKVSESQPISIVFYRTASMDPKTGKMEYTDWKSNMTGGSSDVPSVTLNNIDGYTIKATASTGQEVTTTADGNKTIISGVSALKDGQPTDVTINVDYINDETGKPIEPDAQNTTTTLELVDGDKVMASQTASGLAGTTAKVTLQIPDGYKLADGVTLPDTITLANEDKTLTYKIVKTTSTDPDKGDSGNTGDDKTEVTQVINYVDQETQKIVATQTVTGQAGTMYQPIIEGTPDKSKNEVLIKAPDNYELAKQEIKPFTLATGAAAISILVNAVIVPEAWDKHKQDPNYYREIKQTVTYNLPGQEPTTNTYQVIYYRNGSYNKATGETTYDEWQAAKKDGVAVTSFSAHNVSLATGYTPVVTMDGKQITLEKDAQGNLVIPAVQTTPDSKDTNYVVNYEADSLSFKINYVNNADKQVVSSQTITGKAGESVDIKAEIPENWQVVPNTPVPNGKYTFGGQAPKDITVLIEPKTIYAADNMDNPDYHKTVHGTVSVAFPGQEAKVENQSNVSFIRDATYNPETKKYDFTAWKSNMKDGSTTFAGVNVPVIKGYTISVNASSGEKITPVVNGETATISGGSALVNGTPEDVNVQVTYINDQTGKEDPIVDPSSKEYTYTINYLDGETKVGSQSVTGKAGTTADISAQVPNGYKLAEGITIPTTYTFSDKNETLNVQVVKDTTNPDNPDNPNNPDQEVTQEIQYISDGTVVKTDKLTGKAGTSFKVITSGTAQDGEVLIQAPEYYTWAGQTSIPTVINLSKDAKPITFNVAPITYYGNSTENQSNPEMYKTVTGTYDFTMPGGSTSQSKTTLAFYRDRTMDPKTGTWKYSDWKSNMQDGSSDFASMTNLKVVDGYTIKVTTSTGQEITPSISGSAATISGVSGLKDGQPIDVTINVDYINDKTGTTDTPVDPNKTYSQVVNFINKADNQQVGSQTISGKAGETVDYTLTAPEGYQIMSGQPAGGSITFGTEDLKPMTVYVEKKTDPNQEYTYTINYDYNGQTVSSQSVKGKAGQEVSVELQVPENYQLVNGQQVPSKVTFGNQDMSTTINIEPKVIQGNTESNQNNPEVYRTVTGTYNVTIPGEKTNTQTAQLAFYRTATYNPATGKYDYSEWKSNMKDGATTFASLAVPADIQGYTLKVTTDTGQTITPTVEGTTATISGVSGLKDGQPTDAIITVEYINDQTGKPDNPDDTTRSVTINYVYNDQTVGSQTASGKIGESKTITYEVPENYQLIPNGDQITTGTTIKFGNDQLAPITVQVQPKVIDGQISGNQNNPEVYKTVTAHYTINIPATATKTFAPTLSFYRTATYNPATGKYDYSEWKSNMEDGSTTFAGITVPNDIQGYTLQVTANDGRTITPTIDGGNAVISGISGLVDGQPENVDVTVDYINNATGKPDTNPSDTTRSLVINYVNKADNQIVSTQTVTGKVGEKVSFTNDVPAGYQIVGGQSIIGSPITFGIGQMPTETIYVEKTGSTDPTNPDKDKTYTQVINFVDNGKTIASQNVTGKSGETVQISLDLPKGYKVASGSQIPSKVTFGNSDPQAINVNVEANIITENGLSSKAADLYRVITRTITFNMPSSNAANTQMLVSLAEGTNSNTQSQSIVLYRIKTTNEATGQVTYSDWKSNTVDSSGNPVTEFEAVKIPTIQGYKADVTGANIVNTADGQEIAAQPVLTTNGQPISDTNINIEVNYVADSNPDNPDNPNNPDQEVTQEIQYISDGTVVKTDKLTGKAGTSFKVITSGTAQDGEVLIQAPEYYTWAGQTSIPTVINLSKDAKPITFNVAPITYYGNSTENQSNPEMYQTVTGTYKFTLPGGSTSQSTTKLYFYRNRTMDPKTGTWKYSDWKSNMQDGSTDFASMTNLKVVDGYTIKVTTSTGQEITPSISGSAAIISGVSGLKDGQPTDVTINVDYINDKTGTTDKPVNPDQEYTYTINYDYNGQTVSSQSVKGKAGQEVSVDLQVPENYQIVNGQQVPSKVTFGNQDMSTTINIEPKVIQGNTEEGKKNPELYKQVALTYEVATPGQASETKSGGTLDFYRNATYNPATGKYDYSEWKSNMEDGSTTFGGKMVVPVIDGYDLKVTTSDGQTITPTIDGDKATISGISALVNNQPVNVSVQIQYINKNTGKPDTPDTVHTMTINFVNNGDKQIVSTQTVTGKTGETVNFKLDIPTNWEVVPGTSIPSGQYTFGSQDPAAQTVLIQPKTINGNDPANQNNPEVYRTVTDTVIVNYPGKEPVVQNASLSFYRNGTIDPATGKWTYGEWQSNMSDKSTTFPTITVSTINGYTIVATTNDGRTITPLIQGNTATISGVSGLKDGQPSDVTIAINYKNDSTGDEDNPVDPNAKLYTYTINYMDGDKQVASQTLTGPQGSVAQITANIPNGYKLADGVTVPTTYTFGDKNETLNVSVVKDSSNPDNPDKDDTTTVSGLDDKTNPDLYREITQTITITSPDGKSQSVENHLIFYRDKTTNNKTGQTTYTDWKSNSGTEGHLVTDFGELEVPTLKGYEVVATKGGQKIDLISKDGKLYLPAQPGLVNGTPDNQAISITYDAQTQSVKINFVDKDNQVISTQTVTGKTGETIKLNLDIPKNWQLVPNTTIPTSVTIGANDNKDIAVQIEHKLTIVDGRNDQSNPELFKQVTRTVIMNWPGQTAGKSTASLAFYRVATTDEVTGKTTYSKWQSASTTSQYPEQVVSMAGYTAESSDVQLVTKDGKQYVPATDASFNSEGVPVDSTIIVNYVGDKQEVKINYVENGQTVSTQTLTGQTGQTIAIPLDIPAGYEVANGASIPTQITFGKDTKPMTVEITKIPAGSQKQTINYVDPNGKIVGSQYVTGKIGSTVEVKETLPINWKLANGETVPTSVIIKDTDTPINIKVVSTTVQVDPNSPKTPGTEIDGAHGQTYPNGLTEQDLNKTVTRTVNIVDPLTGKVATTIQTVKFTRTATVEVATGEVSYGDWTASGDKSFASIKVPVIDGYTASGSVDEITPTADYGNQTLTITYTKNGSEDSKTDSEKYKPEVSETTSITTNGEIKPEDVIKNADKMPDGTKFEWTDPDKVAEDLKKPGTYKDVGVKITYPDKSTTTVTTTIVVSDKQEASYTQEIIFKDEKTGKEIRSFKFTGPLTDGKATLSADKLKSVIESLFEVIKAAGDSYKNAIIVSLPTKDVEVTGGDNAPIVVMVGFENSKPDDSGNTGGNTGDNTDNNTGDNIDHGDNSGNSNNSSSSNTDNTGSDSSNSNTSGSNTTNNTTDDGNKNNNSENTDNTANTTPTDNDNQDNSSDDNDYDDSDSDDEDEDVTPSKTSHNKSASSITTSDGGVANHAGDAQWLAKHGYIVTVGSHGQVLDYVKSPDGKGRIITAQPHSQSAINGASISALEKAGLAGVKNDNNAKLPQTGEENDDKAAIGLGLVTAAGLLGLAGAEKKRKKN